MGMPCGFVLLLAVCLQLIQANHILAVSEDLNYNKGNLACGQRLPQGTPCDCATAFSTNLLFAGFNFSNAICADGAGCVSSISATVCKSPEQMLGTVIGEVSRQNMTWNPSTGVECPNGFFMFGFNPSGVGNTTSTAFAQVVCRSQKVPQNWADTYYEPWNMAARPALSCRPHYLVAGIKVSKQGIAGDLSDIESMLCALPDSPVCPRPSTRGMIVYGHPSCELSYHLNCNYSVVCPAGYGSNKNDVQYQVCKQLGSQVISSLTNISCDNINECNSSDCNWSSSGPGPGCHNCSMNGICSDTVPGYTCACKPGYTGDGFTCTSRNYCNRSCSEGETPDSSASACHNCPQYAVNTPGSYEAKCVPLPGNFTCECPLGYQGKGGSREDLATDPCYPINECYSKNDTCPRGVDGKIALGWVCVDKDPNPTDPALFNCVCAPGFGGTNCTDINECEKKCNISTDASFPLGICHNCNLDQSVCMNNVGAVADCKCLPGYEKNNATGLCDDVDECLKFPCNSTLPGVCINLVNKFECLPVITNATLLGNRSSPTGLTNISQGFLDQVLLTIQLPTAGVSWDSKLFYGSSLQPKAFSTSCTTSSPTLFLCNMTTGAGANLTFALSACLISSGLSASCPPSSTISFPAFRFSYPPPTLDKASLCSVGGNGTCGSNVTVAYRGILTMNGTNFINVQELVKVTFGSNGSTYNCAIQKVSFGSLSCIPESVYSGSNFTFSVTVGADSSAQTVKGLDVFNFRSAETASVVSIVPANLSSTGGCRVEGRMLVNCPCVGGVEIIVAADQALLGPVTFKVDGKPAEDVVGGFVENATSIRCKLPPGVGSSRPVFLTTQGTKNGSPENLISYQRPIIEAIISDGQCSPTTNPLSLSNCRRSGGGLLYLVGKNFGASGALVLTNAQNIQATHLDYLGNGVSEVDGRDRYLSFNLPQGSAPQTVIVFQKNGNASLTQVSYDYEQCPAGTYLSGIVCINCSPGKYTNSPGASVCTNCSKGSYQRNGNQTRCLECVPGTFSGAEGQTDCAPCSPGERSSFQSVACERCIAGTFNPVNGSSVCDKCQVGRNAPTPGSTTCAMCEPGTFADVEATIVCQPCIPGKWIEFLGATFCKFCSSGTYQDSFGQSTCKDCPNGTYTDFTREKSNCSVCDSGKFAQSDKQGCEICEPGRYQEGSGPSTECLVCSVGRIASGKGFGLCVGCEAGRFINVTAGRFCFACEAGSYLSEEMQPKIGCVSCDPGKYSAVPGSSGCINCSPGSYQADYNATVCAQCIVGKVAPDAGSYNCTNCTAKKYQNAPGQPDCPLCPAGRFSTATAATSCEQCPPGSYSNPGSERCIACLPGSYQFLFDQTSCVLCDAGKYANKSSSSTCIDCAPGKFAKETGMHECELCNAGFASTSGQSACAVCTGGKYAGSRGQERCIDCPPGTYADSTASSCKCPVGFYSVPTSSHSQNNLTSFCQQCVTGFVCLHDGVTFEKIAEAPGYWRPPPYLDITVYRCAKPSLCLGARQCKPHRVGPMCALCEEGYKASGPAASCGLCSADGAETWGYTVGIIILVIFLLCIFYYVVLKVTSSQQIKLEKLAALKDEQTIKHIEELQQEFAVDDAYFEAERAQFAAKKAQAENNASTEQEEEQEEEEEGSNSEVDLRAMKVADDRALVAMQGNTSKSPIIAASGGRSSIGQIVRPGEKSLGDEVVNEKGTFRLKHLSMASRRAPNFMYKVKILVGFFQIASILPLQGDIAWPTAFTEFISVFTVLNFDFIPWQSLTCATKITYFGRTILVGCIPIVVVLALVLFFYVPMYLHDLDSISDQLRKQHKRNRRNRQFIRLLLFTVFLLYPFVSKVVLGIYNCVTVEGVSYLVADFELLCFDSQWQSYAGVCALFVLMYPIGIPVIYYAILRRSYADLHEPAVILQFGFLYEAYNDKRWYWELIDLVHKLILTSVVIFAPPAWILGVNIVVICIYLIMILIFHPYIRKGDDRFHLLTQTELFMLALVGYVIQSKNIVFTNDPAIDGLLSTCLILIVLFLVLSFGVIAGRNIQKIWIHTKAKKRAKALQAITTNAVPETPDEILKTPKVRLAPLEL